ARPRRRRRRRGRRRWGRRRRSSDGGAAAGRRRRLRTRGRLLLAAGLGGLLLAPLLLGGPTRRLRGPPALLLGTAPQLGLDPRALLLERLDVVDVLGALGVEVGQRDPQPVGLLRDALGEGLLLGDQRGDPVALVLGGEALLLLALLERGQLLGLGVD